MDQELDFSARVVSLAGDEGDLSEYRGKTLLIVNTASACGLTPQLRGLEKLYQTHKDQGLVVLGFPCNQFAGQEPRESAELAEFCSVNYGVTFPMHAKVTVNGAGTHPLFKQLKAAAPGVLGTQSIKWNFTKFLVDGQGRIVKRYGPRETPEGIEADVAKHLA